MYLIFDTETTGMYQFKLPPTDPRQPDIIQIGMLVLDDKFTEMFSFSSLIHARKKIEEGAQAIHGITEEQCNKYGVDIDSALDLFITHSFSCKKIVAHNLQFDARMILKELNEEFCVQGDKKEVTEKHFEANGFCTMEATTPLLKLQGKIPGKYKWPKLIEACNHFGINLDKAHDALADCRACAEIFRRIYKPA